MPKRATSLLPVLRLTICLFFFLLALALDSINAEASTKWDACQSGNLDLKACPRGTLVVRNGGQLREALKQRAKVILISYEGEPERFWTDSKVQRVPQPGTELDDAERTSGKKSGADDQKPGESVQKTRAGSDLSQTSPGKITSEESQKTNAAESAKAGTELERRGAGLRGLSSSLHRRSTIRKRQEASPSQKVQGEQGQGKGESRHAIDTSAGLPSAPGFVIDYPVVILGQRVATKDQGDVWPLIQRKTKGEDEAIFTITTRGPVSLHDLEVQQLQNTDEMNKGGDLSIQNLSPAPVVKVQRGAKVLFSNVGTQGLLNSIICEGECAYLGGVIAGAANFIVGESVYFPAPPPRACFGAELCHRQQRLTWDIASPPVHTMHRLGKDVHLGHHSESSSCGRCHFDLG